ncbi:MAG: DJ-1/PfpI family protein [Endomicrobia bacterium]|nr:DJ-1/PfpI family protein [Endomicrobiia bacterium]
MKIVMIIAKENFRDEEYLHPKEVFEKSNFIVDTFSSSKGTAVGMLGAKVQVDKTLEDLDIDNYDALVFVGGVGAKIYFEDKKVHQIVKDAYKKGKVVAAICIAPVILAKSSILESKNATVYPSEVETLKKLKANYTGKDVEADGKIVTASGPYAAKQFAEKIKQILLAK